MEGAGAVKGANKGLPLKGSVKDEFVRARGYGGGK